MFRLLLRNCKCIICKRSQNQQLFIIRRKIMKKLWLFVAVLTAAVVSAQVKPVTMDMIDCQVDSDINWQKIGSKFCNLSGAGYVTATDAISPYSNDVAFEMDVKPLQKVSRGLGDCGVVLSSPDRKLIWRLLLRDNSKTRHADMTIVSSFPGVNHRTVKFKCVEGKGFRWQYKKTYRMRIEKQGEKITGTIMLDGKVVAKYTAPDKSKLPVTSGYYAGPILSEFSNAAVKTGKAVKFTIAGKKAVKPEYVPFRNISKKFKAKATGFFYTKQDETGRWWLVDPAGNGFFACGTDGVSWHGRHCEALGYHPYLRSVRAIYDTEEEWCKNTLNRFNSWGFNFAGTCSKIFTTRIPFANNLMIGSTFASLGDEYDICPYEGHVGSALPNPFHPRFGEYARKRYMRNVGEHIENPYFIGYYCDNELRWGGMTSTNDGTGVFNTVMRKNSKHTAKIALVKFLKERYNGDVAAFNKDWNTKIASFDELLKINKLPQKTAVQLAAKLDFLSYTAETYFKTLRDNLKAVDPNHLFLGCRYAGLHAHERIWKANAKYCDIVSFNIYPTYNKNWDEMYAGNKTMIEVIDELYERCKRPIFITEWAFLGLDSGLPCTNGAGQRFYTQKERAHAAGLFYKMMLGHKAMVGMSWYEFSDDPYLGVRRRHPENSNYGLVNKDDKPYEELVNTFKKINDNLDEARNYTHVPNVKVKEGAIYKEFSRKADKLNPKIRVKTTKNSFDVSNGRIRLCSTKSERIEVFYGRNKRGYFRRMLNTTNEIRAWTGIRNVRDIKVTPLKGGVSIAFAGDAVSVNGKAEVKSRIFVPNEGKYAMFELVKIKNIGKTPLLLGGFYCQMWASFRHLPPDPSVSKPNYTGWSCDAWVTHRAEYLGYATTLGKFGIAFMNHREDGYKADAALLMHDVLKPGESYAPATPAYIFIYTGDGAFKRHGEALVKKDLKQ